MGYRYFFKFYTLTLIMGPTLFLLSSLLKSNGNDDIIYSIFFYFLFVVFGIVYSLPTLILSLIFMKFETRFKPLKSKIYLLGIALVGTEATFLLTFKQSSFNPFDILNTGYFLSPILSMIFIETTLYFRKSRSRIDN